MYVVAIGSPFNGMTLVGPFSDYDDALDYMDDQPADCWIVSLIEVGEGGPEDA